MKRLIRIFLLSIFFIIGTSIVSVYAEQERIYGDINFDGNISLRDALLILNSISHPEQSLSDLQKKYSDVNKDSSVTIEDARDIFQYTLNELADFKANEIISSGVVWVAGDSIAAPVDRQGLVTRYGWGEVIGDYLTDGTTVHDQALGGRSSKSFTTENNYKTMIQNISAGDYMLVSFGHNDVKQDEARYTSPGGSSDTEGSFKYYLKHYYIEPALAKGAQPVIISCVVRCSGLFEKPDNQSHYSYALAARSLCEEYAKKHIYIPFVDMFNITFDFYTKITKETALTTYHAIDENGEPDSTHYNETGARFASQLILTELKKQNVDLCKFMDFEKIVDPRDALAE